MKLLHLLAILAITAVPSATAALHIETDTGDGVEHQFESDTNPDTVAQATVWGTVYTSERPVFVGSHTVVAGPGFDYKASWAIDEGGRICSSDRSCVTISADTSCDFSADAIEGFVFVSDDKRANHYGGNGYELDFNFSALEYDPSCWG